MDPDKIGVGGDSAGGNMTCVMALKLRARTVRASRQVPLFPEAAFPADTLAASENRTGLYLETNGIYEMVRNLVKNSDDGPPPLHHAAERELTRRPTTSHSRHERVRPTARCGTRLRAEAGGSRQRPHLCPQSRPHPRLPAVHALLEGVPARRPWNSLTSSRRSWPRVHRRWQLRFDQYTDDGRTPG